MALPVIADVVRCSIFGTVEGGVNWSNTIHYRKDPTDTFPNAIANVQPQLVSLYTSAGFGGTKFGWGHYSTDGSFCTGMIHTPLDGTTASTAFAVSLAGLSSQEPLPPQNAIAITLNTGLRGRSFRGRVYWASTSREMTAGGLLNPVDAAFVDSAWEEFVDQLQALVKPVQLGVASYHLGSFTPCLGDLPTTTRLVYAHQTKRRGRGA